MRPRGAREREGLSQGPKSKGSYVAPDCDALPSLKGFWSMGPRVYKIIKRGIHGFVRDHSTNLRLSPKP